uniref:Putative chemosensory protein n=1 Tax=Triatoma brasiliensis TaxID=65344 RepID=A0A162RE11_TRIBS|nr:putative chemosensory protein [Triatoma brasiliensis]
MMLLSLCLAWLMFGMAFCRPDSEEDAFYYQVFEEIDVDIILDNERLLRSYLTCFFDEAPCSAHAAAVKESIPEVMSTVCGKCNDKQKAIYKHALNKFIPTHKEDWDHILRIYDPNGEYWPNIKKFMES